MLFASRPIFTHKPVGPKGLGEGRLCAKKKNAELHRGEKERNREKAG